MQDIQYSGFYTEFIPLLLLVFFHGMWSIVQKAFRRFVDSINSVFIFRNQ